MYKIIGADQKEYGPISGDHLRQWIAEGRVNGNTQACAEGTAQWQPLAAYAEFAAVLGIEAPEPTAAPTLAARRSDGLRDAALQAVKGPAISLIVVAAAYMVYCIWAIVRALFTHPDLSALQQLNTDPQVQKLVQLLAGPLGAVGSFLQLIFAVFILMGALRMLALRNYQLAFTAAILAMLPCYICCVFGLPFGIWAVVILNRPEVKSQFGQA